jgi:hypothetical protein
MPELRGVFEMTTKQIEPDTDAWRQQEERQRRAGRNRRNGALAVVAAIAIVATVLVIRLAGGGDGSQPAITPSPTPSPVDEITFPYVATVQPTVDVPLVEFGSAMYGYSISVPEIWSMREATESLKDLEEPLDVHASTDYFSRTAPDRSDPGLLIAAQPLDPGTSLHEWTSEVEELVDPCGPPATRETVRVGGEKATLAYLADCTGPAFFMYWTTIVHDGTGFHVIWWGNTGDEARDRAVLDRILASLVFTD